MQIRTAVSGLIVLLFVPLMARGEIVKQMFEVSLPVVNQERDIRDAAFEQGFVDVLVRVSGSSQVVSQIDTTRAARYVQQFRYLPLEQPVENETAAVAGIESSELAVDMPQAKYNLWLQFNEGKIKNLLRENSLPVWGKQRPSVLMWLAVRDGRNRYILRQQDISAIKDAVNKESDRRGLPLLWPAFDNQDQVSVSFTDIWGSFWGPIQQASKRYGVDAIVVGRMDWMDGSWQVDWSMMLDNNTASWQLKALDLKLLMASGIDVATDQIARRFAVLENVGNAGELTVQINGIQQVDSYARISRYLLSLAPVKNVFVTNIKDDVVKFHVAVTGDQNDLKRIIALGKTLTPVPTIQPVTNPKDPNNLLSLQQPGNVLTYTIN
ncbi:MAG: DUF2066 domain-containing protein [Gammaproteobacteria bacterium]|nr:DUF2066 domain-containing protein [Gammaproteobacteria bacterium]